MAKIIKEIIIMLLVCLVTMLVLAISLYKFIPNRKIVPEIATYKASEEVQDLLEDNIDQNTNQTSQNIATYEVTAGELKGYQKTNIYVPGKSNPFAPASKSVSGDGENTGSDGNNSSDGTSSENNTSNNKKNDNPNSSNQTTSPSIYQNNGSK